MKEESSAPTSAPLAASAKRKRTPRTDQTEEAIDLSDPQYYLNRELTWLSFNARVLHEAGDSRTPLLERVKFLSIVGSNLDEFFMKRIGGLKQQVGAGMRELTVDGRRPEQQIAESYTEIRTMENRQQEVLRELKERLREHEIVLASYTDLTSREQGRLREYYIDNIFPLVTPQAMDPAHPFPFISNLSLNLLVSLHHPKDTAITMARVKVPIGAGIPRFLRVRSKSTTFVSLEEVMAHNLDLIFPGMEVDGYALFRVTRNANTALEEDRADDLLEAIESGLRERKFAPIVRLEVLKGTAPSSRGMLAAELGLDEEADVFEIDGMLGIRDLMEIAVLDIPSLHDKPHHPTTQETILSDRSIFHIIRDEGAILVHHPYDSFETSVERFLREASEDPKVRAIKMTLYRTSARSLVIEHLLNAARNGKQVAVAVELKARFDEEANIRWANRLEEAGIHVNYGVMGVKTHCKVILVVRQDYDGLRRYAHIGTGNYHSGTARIYSDLGLFTAEEGIGGDCTELFNYLTTGYKPKRSYKKILPAPAILKKALLAKIAREVKQHSSSSPGSIQFKCNALADFEIGRALYQASQAGVKIDLIVRDSCQVRPGIPGLSENIRVISIIGRFLEHARVYYFRNGGKEEYYIGSSDCLTRNLERRVESLAPVESPNLMRMLRLFLDIQLSDRRSAWDMQSDGRYVQRTPGQGDDPRSSQEILIDAAERNYKQATRLRKRKTRGIAKRNVR